MIIGNTATLHLIRQAIISLFNRDNKEDVIQILDSGVINKQQVLVNGTYLITIEIIR